MLIDYCSKFTRDLRKGGARYFVTPRYIDQAVVELSGEATIICSVEQRLQQNVRKGRMKRRVLGIVSFDAHALHGCYIIFGSMSVVSYDDVRCVKEWIIVKQRAVRCNG